jgi:hypothetical protein
MGELAAMQALRRFHHKDAKDAKKTIETFAFFAPLR